jgi:hypothetical protein
MSTEREDIPETIETIYLEDENKVIKISQTINEEKKIDEPGPIEDPNTHKAWHVIHYVSWIFGVILTVMIIGYLTICPLHNPLEEPEYYWEFMLFIAFGWVSCTAANFVLRTYFWANINPGNNGAAFMVMSLLTSCCILTITIIQNTIWTNKGHNTPVPFVFGYYPAMAFSDLVLNFLTFFRYLLTLVFLINVLHVY